MEETTNSVECKNCKQKNAADNVVCTNCGQPLTQPVSQPPNNSLTSSHPPGTGFLYRTELWFRGLEPPLRACVAVLVALFVLVGVESVIPLVGCIGALPFGLIAYAAQGILVVKYARERGGYVQADYSRLAFKSSLWTIAFGSALRFLGALVVTGATLGAAILALPIYLISAIAGGIIPIIVTVLFAKLHSENRLPKLTGPAIVLIIVVTVIFSCLLLAIAGTVGLGFLINNRR